MGITCNCEKGGVCEIHPKAPKLPADPKDQAAPVIDANDKLQLKTLEAESLKAQLNMRTAMERARQEAINAQQQLDAFAAAMLQKAGLKPEEWILDLAQLKFFPRGGQKA